MIVQSLVIGVTHHEQVLNTVVVLDAVDVMDLFVRCKLTTEMRFDRQPVLRAVLPDPGLYHHVAISVGVLRTNGLFDAANIGVVTCLRTEITSFILDLIQL